jgi:signal transduction histidine kinase
MRLAEFISKNTESILVRWEAFAATCLPAAAKMEPLALRDHAHQILVAIVMDLNTPQTREAQSAKSMGLSPVIPGAPHTAAQTHAILRARSGFDINQLAAEYRALRASVLQQWMDSCSDEKLETNDIIRFNEAIDQALTESITSFSHKVEESRDLLLGMLGHDMRSPLQTIQATASLLAALNAGGLVSEAAGRLIKSGSRIKALLDELLDFNRINLGLGIPICPAKLDLASLLRGTRSTSGSESRPCHFLRGIRRSWRDVGRFTFATGPLEPGRQRHQIRAVRYASECVGVRESTARGI